MARHACRFDRRFTRRTDPPSYPQQRRSLELRPIHISKHSKGRGSAPKKRPTLLGNGASWRVRWIRTRPRGPRAGYQAQVALRDSSAMGLVARPDGDSYADVRRRPIENLEQHAHRDESRAPPTAPLESAHGRALPPNQPALPF